VDERVRVTMSEDRGVVTGIGEGRLTLALDDGGWRACAGEEIERLERSRGERPLWKEGLLIGTGLGVVMGFGVGDFLLFLAEAEGDGCAYASRKDCVMAWTLLLGLSGFAVGTLTKTEKWEVVPVLDVGPSTMAAGVRVRY